MNEKVRSGAFLQYIARYVRLGFEGLKSRQMIILSLLPFGVSMLVWVAFLLVSITHFSWYIGQFPSIWVEYAMAQSSVFSVISYYLLYTLAIISMILYGILIFGVCNVLISMFISPFVVAFVVRTYYPHLRLSAPNFMESFKISSLIFLKTFAQFVGLSLLCYCLGFIGLGFIGVILSVFIYFRFFSVNLNYEIALNIMDKAHTQRLFNEGKIALFFINVIIFIPLYIPGLNLFVLVWQMLTLSHFMLEWYDRTQSEVYVLE